MCAAPGRGLERVTTDRTCAFRGRLPTVNHDASGGMVGFRMTDLSVGRAPPSASARANRRAGSAAPSHGRTESFAPWPDRAELHSGRIASLSHRRGSATLSRGAPLCSDTQLLARNHRGAAVHHHAWLLQLHCLLVTLHCTIDTPPVIFVMKV